MFAGWGVAGKRKASALTEVLRYNPAPVAVTDLASRIVMGCPRHQALGAYIFVTVTGCFHVVFFARPCAPVFEGSAIFLVDKEKVMAAVQMFLEGIGEDTAREGLLETPERVARMCQEIYSGMDENPGAHLDKQFAAPNSELVVEKDITFYSTCEHHLMPFYGKVHLAYIPNGNVTGLSKLARLVEGYASRAQIQEQLTTQIADALEHHLSPKGVMVMIEAEHTCMTMRGVKKPGSKTVTTATRGEFRDSFDKQRQFLEMVK